jgi:hypothetical protein
MNADVAAGKGERIDAWVINHKEREIMIAIIRLCRNAVADFIDVLGELWVFDDLSAEADIAHDRPPDLGFGRFVQNRVGRAAHVRYLNVIGTGTAYKHNGCNSDEGQGALGKIDDQQKLLKITGS